MAERSLAARRLVICTDVVGYGRHGDPGTQSAQLRLIDVLDSTYAAIGVQPTPLGEARFTVPVASGSRGGDGDATIDLLPPDVPEARTVSRFVRELPVVLAALNRELADPMRLRVAIGQGLAEGGVNGISGRVVTPLCRIRDSDVARAAIELSPAAGVVVLLQEDIYVSSVLDGEYGLEPAQFVRVRVPAKSRDVTEGLTAWLTLPGLPPPELPGGPDEPDPGPPPTVPPDRTSPPPAPGLGPRVDIGGLVFPDSPLPPAGPV
jgi:hypothetical protein